MNLMFAQHRYGWLAVVILAMCVMMIGVENADADSIMFQSSSIGSQAIGPTDPWFGSRAYWYMDGWNHAPRVPPEEYDEGEWTPGGHAGAGTAAEGWTSLDNEHPEWLALDFDGYVFSHNSYEDDLLSPWYGHEDRWYDNTEGAWTLWNINGPTPVQVATGTLGTLYMDIFYDPVNAGQPEFDPFILGWGTATAINDGGAFYNELMARRGTSVLNLWFYCDEPPVQAVNPDAAQVDMWAIYGMDLTMEPVPISSTLVLVGIGLIWMGISRRRWTQ